MKHPQNDELFAALETAKFRLAELRNKPETDAEATRYWNKRYDSIMEKLIKANQGLVGSFVRKYKKLLASDELGQVGKIALAKAILAFDPSLGNQFSTFAHLPIKGAMLRAINKNGIIRIPEEKIGRLNVLKKAMNRLRDEDGEGYKNEPSPDDVAWAMGIPVEEVRELLALDKRIVSLDASRNAENGSSPYDTIADATAVDPTKEAKLNDDTRLLKQAVDALPKRDADVMVSAAGLFGHSKLSFEEIGKRNGFSRQRAQQIFDTAKDEIAAFIRSARADCNGKIAKQRLGLHKNPPLAAVTKVAKFTPASGKPYYLKMRAVEKNPNHHIWNNNGTWYCKFTLILIATGESNTICNSLDTKDVELARHKRDVLIRLYNEPTRSEAA